MRKIIGYLFTWFKDGLSIDETRISLIMLLLTIFGFISAFYIIKYQFQVDIPDNVVDLMKLLAVIVGGINVVSEIKSRFGNVI